MSQIINNEPDNTNTNYTIKNIDNARRSWRSLKYFIMPTLVFIFSLADLLGYHTINTDKAVLIVLAILASVISLESTRTNRRIDAFEADWKIVKRINTLSETKKSHLTDVIIDRIKADNIEQQEGVDHAFSVISSRHLTQMDELTANISNGCIILRQAQAADLQEELVTEFSSRFDAVSNRDLSFWAHEYRSEGYFEVLRKAIVQRSLRVNRVFIFSIKDVEKRRDEMARVLLRQHEAEMGWAIAISEDFGREVRALEEAGCNLDFALFNCNEAVSFFLDTDSPHKRTFKVLFDLENRALENRKMIKLQAELFSRLVGATWLSNSIFCQNYQKYEEDWKTANRSKLHRESSTPGNVSVSDQVRKRLFDLKTRLQPEDEAHKLLSLDFDHEPSVLLSDSQSQEAIAKDLLRMRDLHYSYSNGKLPTLRGQ